MQFYLVGGAVRDKLLNIAIKDRDWVVTGATPQALIDKGFTPIGKDFPVFLHPKTKEEYALARTERKTGHGYTGFTFYAEKSVTLEQDLQRRDLTINAIAQNEEGDFFDPYGGISDLNNKILRHVSEAFREDPVRVLRIARFAARFHHLGFCIAPSTLMLMREMTASGELDHLVAERVWQEIHGALSCQNPHVFFQVLRHCGALKVLMPELDILFGVPQPKKHHPEIDTGLHAILTLKAASELSDKTTVRFASLIHDLGKGLTPKEQWPKHLMHEISGLASVKNVCARIKAPNEFKELALIAAEFHTHVHRAFELSPKAVLILFKQTDAFRRPERFEDFLLCAKSDSRGRTFMQNIEYSQTKCLHQYLLSLQSIKPQDILKENPQLKGEKIGEEIDKKRLAILDEQKRSIL